MKRYLLDTNVLLHALKQDAFWVNIAAEFELGSSQNFISVVSLGELYALSLRNNWGAAKTANLQLLKTYFGVLDINVELILQKYAEIDAFSQGKLQNMPLSVSSRNMGKNDLWIAATASAFQLPLLSNDKDFGHLDGAFLDLMVLG